MKTPLLLLTVIVVAACGALAFVHVMDQPRTGEGPDHPPGRPTMIVSGGLGHVARVHFREGRHFKAGDILVELDAEADRRTADLERVAAERRGSLKQAEELLANAMPLDALHTALAVHSLFEVQMLRTQLRADEEALVGLKGLVQQRQVRAEADGMVLAVLSQEGMPLAPGKPMLHVVYFLEPAAATRVSAASE